MSYFASFADCGDKKCNNGGTLNAETCECECKKIYTGPTCDECKIFYIVKLVNLSFLRKKKWWQEFKSKLFQSPLVTCTCSDYKDGSVGGAFALHAGGDRPNILK